MGIGQVRPQRGDCRQCVDDVADRAKFDDQYPHEALNRH
jgi:hypothetical protein